MPCGDDAAERFSLKELSADSKLANLSVTLPCSCSSSRGCSTGFRSISYEEPTRKAEGYFPVGIASFELPSPLSEMPIDLLETSSRTSWRLNRQLRPILFPGMAPRSAR